jgi:hypothetical protein
MQQKLVELGQLWCQYFSSSYVQLYINEPRVSLKTVGIQAETRTRHLQKKQRSAASLVHVFYVGTYFPLTCLLNVLEDARTGHQSCGLGTL